jgi:hypothetical protein
MEHYREEGLENQHAAAASPDNQLGHLHNLEKPNKGIVV